MKDDEKRFSKIAKYLVKILVIIVILSITMVAIIDDVIEEKEKVKDCESLGFETITTTTPIDNGETICVKEIGFDHLKNQYIKCYMPLNYNINADEFCSSIEG